MAFKVQLEKTVVEKDLKKIDNADWHRLKKAIAEKLTTQPHQFGQNLRTPLQKYRKLRVGDWRIVYRVETKTVKIFAIQPRAVVYEGLQKRLKL